MYMYTYISVFIGVYILMCPCAIRVPVDSEGDVAASVHFGVSWNIRFTLQVHAEYVIKNVSVYMLLVVRVLLDSEDDFAGRSNLHQIRDDNIYTHTSIYACTSTYWYLSVDLSRHCFRNFSVNVRSTSRCRFLQATLLHTCRTRAFGCTFRMFADFTHGFE